MRLQKESQPAGLSASTIRSGSKVFRYCLFLVVATYGYALAQEQLKQRSDFPTPAAAQLNLDVYILYFDQSSSVLRPGVKATLDSIARQLIEQPRLMATLTGYTDNVGTQELNWRLAEQRAKTVENYLKQRSVRANQIKATWEGPDTKPPAGNSGKTISRRVFIQLSPKD